jgi:hypothetical protein
LEVEYFKDFDTDAVYACVGPMGVTAMFRLKKSLAGEPEWEFLVPESPTWDRVHQRLYLDRRWVETVNPHELPAPLPPIPEIPPGPFPHPREYFVPEGPINALEYPSVTGLLKTRGEVTVFVVLFEDPYETALGDGEFHFFRDVFLNRADAQRYIDQNKSTGEQFHLRTMSIMLDSGTLGFPDFRVELFDRYTVEEVLKTLEAHLRG